MAKTTHPALIRLRGVRQNNLKNIDLDLPLGKMIVVTGLSGSGKSSLAFDTLYAEGQRRYIETFTPYARQFFDRMDKPQVDKVEGIPPAIAIEQRNAVRTTRSTVGTMTEIADYMKVLWSHVARLHCRHCGQVVYKEEPSQIWSALVEPGPETVSGRPALHPDDGPWEVLIVFILPLSEKLALAESLDLVAKQGYQRLLVEQRVVRIDKLGHQLAGATAISVVQDMVRIEPAQRTRFVEACEQAYHFGRGKLTVFRAITKAPGVVETGAARFFSNQYHCASCDIAYREPTPAMFSFNHPLGACPKCRGFGRTITIDYDRALPDRTRTLEQGVVRPWQSGFSAECQEDLIRFCRKRRVPTNIPFEDLTSEWQSWVINGDPDYGQDPAHEYPHAWYGVKGYFRWLESKSYKMHVRVLLSRYRAYVPCPDCHGNRFQPDSLLFQVTLSKAPIGPQTSCPQPRMSPPPANSAPAPATPAPDPHPSRPFTPASPPGPARFTLADFYRLPIRDALAFVESLKSQFKHCSPSHPLALALGEVHSRLAYLRQVGLGYLTLDRPTRTLSGGETERVNLTTCLGSRLVNTLFVLDEPSVGLHARDTARLVAILQRLCDLGNTVLVVEHEAGIIRAADQIVDLGPGHGDSGGTVVFQGSFHQILKQDRSLTGQYLSGRKQMDPPPRRPVQPQTPRLTLTGATLHNLKNVSVQFPLERLVAITGVSGSGKSTLIRDLLLPALLSRIQNQPDSPTQPDLDSKSNDDDSIDESSQNQATLAGFESIQQVILVDQSALGRTPRSNPALYIGAFEDIRELFAQSDLARQRGLKASAFSFNSAQGQCERCRGAGFEKIEMQFLSDVFIRCPDCQGRRYQNHILEITLKSRTPQKTSAPPAKPKIRARRRAHSKPSTTESSVDWSIGDLLDATVDQAIAFLGDFANAKPAQRALTKLVCLQEVGLGYLRLGQPINTLSGGESQRLKLVSCLAAFDRSPSDARQHTLFLFDEPTTGLHFEDIRVLLAVFQRLVQSGHSVIVVEHNLDVIQNADWIIDLGPEAGDQGGQIIAQGTPEQIAHTAKSHTGTALRADRSYRNPHADTSAPLDMKLGHTHFQGNV